MSDNVPITAGLGTDIATDEVAGVHHQLVKIEFGAADSATQVSAVNPLPVTAALSAGSAVIGHVIADSGSTTVVTGNVTVVQGTATNLKVDASGVAVPVTDNAGSLTVDAPVATPVFVRLSDGASAISALPITDNAGSLTVDAPVGTPAFVRLSDGSAAITTLPVSIAASATSIAKAEDAGHTTADTGAFVLAVRNDANATLTNTDLDYSAFSVDSAGNTNSMSRRGLARVSVQSSGLTTASTAYTAGDQVGAQFTVAGCSRASGGSGTIVGVTLVDVNDIIGAYDVVFFDSSVSPASDNAAASWSDADMLKVVGVVQLAGAYDLGANRVAQAPGIAIPYVCSGGTSLYACLICRVGHTFFAAATDLQLIVYVELN